MADEAKTERVQLMMTPSEVRAVDDWSFANRVRGRSEAIRRLIELGLRADKAAGVLGILVADSTNAGPEVERAYKLLTGE